jgi:hypothetical protein
MCQPQVGMIELVSVVIGLLHYLCDSMHPGSGVRFFEIGRGRAGFKYETPSGQFRKTEHLTPVLRLKYYEV